MSVILRSFMDPLSIKKVYMHKHKFFQTILGGSWKHWSLLMNLSKDFSDQQSQQLPTFCLHLSLLNKTYILNCLLDISNWIFHQHHTLNMFKTYHELKKKILLSSFYLKPDSHKLNFFVLQEYFLFSLLGLMQFLVSLFSCILEFLWLGMIYFPFLFLGAYCKHRIKAILYNYQMFRHFIKFY